jgi:hypothetical protein
MNKRFALFSLIVYSGESAAFLGVVTLELLIGPQYAKIEARAERQNKSE